MQASLKVQKVAWPQVTMPVDASKRILMLHYIVFRCIPVALRKVLVCKTQEKFGIMVSGSWLLKNVSGLPRFQRKIINHQDVSKWDASLLCKVLLYSNLHLLTEQIPSSDYIILSPSVLKIMNEITAWKVCVIDRDIQMIIIVQEKFGSTKFVPVKYAIEFTNMGVLHLKLPDGLSAPAFQDVRQLHLCTKQWSAVREMRNIRNQHAHRSNENVSTDELATVTTKMNNALKWLNVTPCQGIAECICFRTMF